MTDSIEAADALNAQIETAKAAGDSEKAQALYQEQQGTAPDGEGDLPAQTSTGAPDADAASVAEALSAVGSPPEGEWTFARPEVVDHQFALMEAAFGDMATDLRKEWGADAGVNLQFADAAAAQFEESFPEVIAVFEKHGGVNDPMVVELLAVIGRQGADTPGDPGTVRLFPNPGGTETRQPNMTDNMATKDIQGRIDALEGVIEKARARGEHSRANDAYLEQLRLGALLPGAGEPIVGRGGRVA